MNSNAQQPGSRTRAGNALFTAIVVMALAATVVATSMESSVTSQRAVVASTHGSEALAALDIVLARRQRVILDMAANAQPETYAVGVDNYGRDLATPASPVNYGVDFVGGCEVRWKVEPVYAQTHDPATAAIDKVIENPTPDGATGAPTNAVDNPTSFFLYRVSAESRYNTLVHHDAEDNANDNVSVDATGKDVLARAQGVRYVTTTNDSVLKYLLYWAQSGSKGDLELSHGPATNLVGHIYSGGSIYFGSGTVCNDWLALRPSNGATTVGPPIAAPTWVSGIPYAIGAVVTVGNQRYQAKDVHTSSAASQPGSSGGTWKAYWEDVTACRVEGMDGVYRMSKQTLFSAFNSFPMASSAPAGFSLSSYILNTTAFPGERQGNTGSPSYLMPDPAYPSDVYNATYQGRVINPARARNPLATVPLSGSDTLRVINVAGDTGMTAVHLRGVDESGSLVGNDSRDTARSLDSSSGYVWATDSLEATAPGFNRQVRSRSNGLAERPLNSRFIGRPEEPQKLVYYDLDGDATTDEHEYAMPEFLSASGTTTDLTQRLQTASMISNGIESIESPGTYLQAALGSNLYLARRTDYKGWKVVDSTGSLANAEPSSGMGLVIRERPRPETSYFTPSILPSPSDLLYMPFAYGHVRASVWPMTACDVAAEMTDAAGTNTSTWTNGFGTTTVAGLTTTAATQRYNTGGSIAFRAATNPGPNYSGGTNDSASAYQRFDYTTRDSWRFIALGRPKVTASNGLNMTIWNDRPGTTWLMPFGGRPVYSTVASGLSVNWTGVPTGSTGVGSDYFSVRWRGFIKPQYTDNYTFYANRSVGDCGIRVWVDDVMVIDSWSNSSSEAVSQARPLAAEQYYPIVVEAYDTTGNFGPRIDWACSSLVRETLPATRVFTQTMPDGFDWNTFSAVETKLDSVSVSTGKAGLMLRASNGISQVMDGREPYVTLGYTPTRGIFAQIRGERSGTSSGTQPGYFIGNGDTDNDANGTFETPLADPNGEIITQPNVATLQRSATLTPVVASMTFAPSAGQQQMYTVYSPGKTAPGAAPAGATSPAGAWPANSGTSALSSQTDWIGSYNGTFTVWTPPTASPLGRTPDKPFSVAEGDVDRVWRSCAALRVQRWPQERSQARLDANFRFYLAGTSTTSQLFRWIPGDAWASASWPAYNSAVDDIDSSSSVKRLFLFSDRVGNRTPSGTFSSTNNLFALGANANNWNGGNADIDTAGTDHGAVLYKTIGGGTTDSGWIYWFLDANADGRPDGAVTTWDKSTTPTSLSTVYYVNSGGVDTRPKVFSGSTLVRVLTQAETLSLMDATYPANAPHVAVTTLPTYPTLDTPAPAYAAGDPPVTDPTVAAAGMGYTRLAAAITNVATTLTVNSGINNGTRGYTIGDILTLSSAAGTEFVAVTGFTDPGTVTVTRGQRGTIGLAHPINALVSQMSIPLSSLGLAALAGDTTLQVRTLGPPILIGDVLQIDGEQVRVTGTTARVGTTSANITVLRAQNGTTAAAHVLESAISTPLPVLGTLSVAHTNVITTLTMGSTAKLVPGDLLQVGTEVMKVASVLSATTAGVTRGYANTVAIAQPLNTTVYRTLGKTFAVSRSRTVTFDRNSWISAGSAPTFNWRTLGSSQADTIDWGYTRASDFGWYWSGVPLYGTWKSFWSAVTPVPVVGGIPPRAYLATWSQPLTGAAPIVDVPASPNTDLALPATAVAGAATGATSRFQDDQPALWTSGIIYQAGDVIWTNNVMYKALTNHTSAAATQPGVGGSWTTAWQQVPLWLRIEKVPATTYKVRLLYALSATRPTSPAEWRPLLTIPQTYNPPGAGRVNANTPADSRELQIDLSSWFKAGRATVSTAMTAVQTTVTLTAPTTGSFAVGDVIQIEDEQMLITGGSMPTWTVYRNWSQTLATVPTHAAGVEVVQARWRGNDLLVGLCSQSGSSATQMDVAASNMRIETTSADPLLATIDASDWESSGASGTAPNDTTRYLCSQYQVFWGPYDITEDFFYHGQDGSVPRCANEDWIYNTRFFWSQSRWWDDLTTEKDPAYLLPDNASVLSMRELLAKTTILSLDMRAVQDYIMTTSLTTALSDRVVGAGPSGQTALSGNYTLRDRVNVDGLLIHASRYNRYPWNPNLKGQNPWMPGYPLGNATNVGGCAALPNTTGGLYTNAALAMLPNESPAFARRTAFEGALGGSIPANSNNLTSGNFADLMPYALGASTTAGQLWRTPPIKPQDYHHAVRILNASNINWSYGTSNDYQSGGMSIFTPNQLYIQGDVNTTAHAVSFGGIAANKANKMGIFCDTAIMLSNSWNDLNYRNPGLTMNTTTQVVTGPFPSTLAMNQGGSNILPTASNTQYQFALLTHTQPTTRASVRMGEASSFISTMQYLEDWSGRTMTLVGSIVAMDSRRYTRSYLLDAQKQHGLSPFGWMTAGGNPASPTAWVTEYSPAAGTTPKVDARWPVANTAGWTQLNNGTSIAVNNRWLGAIQGVYGAPTRNLFYNPDFYYKPGQPPLMPFGTRATGMGGWSKIIQ